MELFGHFFQQDINSVSRVFTVAEASDVHSRSSAYMLDSFKCPDVVVCIINVICRLCCHIHLKDIIMQKYEFFPTWQ